MNCSEFFALTIAISQDMYAARLQPRLQPLTTYSRTNFVNVRMLYHGKACIQSLLESRLLIWSCSCAISHRSPLFSNQNKQMYDDLVTVTVHTSADMSTKLVVVQDDTAFKVDCGRPSLIMKRNEYGLLITLPFAKTERRQSMRGQLSGYLSELLQVYDSRGEKQIYRIINELESGTDEILLDEEISRVSWLAETSRPPSEPETETPPQSQSQSSIFVNGENEDPPRQAQPYLEIQELEATIRAAGSIS